MKKIYAVVLSALLSLSLAGCQQPEASTQRAQQTAPSAPTPAPI